MALSVRAIYENGMLRLLEPLNLAEGQEVQINLNLTSEQDELRAILGDSVIWPDTSDDSDAWVEDMADEIAEALSKGRSLTEIILEERENGW